LLVTANVVPSSLILVTLMMKALHSSEMSVLTRATQRNISDDGVLHSHRHENHKSYSNYLNSFPLIFFTKFSYLGIEGRKYLRELYGIGRYFSKLVTFSGALLFCYVKWNALFTGATLMLKI
jgi:hypothetical protein